MIGELSADEVLALFQTKHPMDRDRRPKKPARYGKSDAQREWDKITKPPRAIIVVERKRRKLIKEPAR